MKRLSVFLALAMAACGGGGSDDQSAPPADAGATEAPVPAETMTDWVTYADQVSTFTVVSDREVSATADDVGPGLGPGQAGGEWRVTIRVDETIWSPSGATPRTGEFEFVVGPWAWHDQTPRRFEVGKQYLAPLADFGWAFVPLTSDVAEIVTAQAGPIADVLNPDTPVLRQIDRDAVADIGRQLAATAPDPDAAPFMHLPPVERAQATAHAKHEAQGGCERVQDC